MFEEKVKAVEAGVQRLEDAKFIREVLYPLRLANTILVKKKNGKWRMFVEFIDLNKACNKDDFPLERVDKIVDDAANSELLSLLYTFSGYHQIRVRIEDEKNELYHSFWNILFRENARRTKESRMYIFKNDSNSSSPQLRRNILEYVDDIVVKSIQRRDHIRDLAETFANLKAANLRLNPKRCIFGVHKGKIIGCIVSTKGIEANPDKIKALIEMQDTVSVKILTKSKC
jgi:hypothetical protein